jgi:hypothetical protein
MILTFALKHTGVGTSKYRGGVGTDKHFDVTLLGGNINAKSVGQKPPLD